MKARRTMSRYFYPSDEYDSIDQEQQRTRRRLSVWRKPWRSDDDDRPSTAPAVSPLPKSPLLSDATQAA